jgi:Holliday junction resolvasome RuvABC endonuclease subunit
MIYLGLDLSTVSTGYSVFDGHKLIEYGKIVSNLPDTMDRITEIVLRLEKIVQKHQPEVATIEDTYLKRGYGSNYLMTKMLNRLAGATYMMLKYGHTSTQEQPLGYRTKGIKIQFAMPTNARKCFGLLPKSTKLNVINAVNSRFKLTLDKKEDDIADGIVLGYAGVFKDAHEDEIFKESEQKFFKTQVRGMKTPPINGMKPRRKRNDC